MKQVFLTSLFVILITSFTFGQAVVSNSGGLIYLNKNTGNNSDLEGKRGSYFGSHYLGDRMGGLYSKFMSYYVSYEKRQEAYATEKMVIHKEPIYDAVRELDKYFKKALRKGNVTDTEARERLGLILERAIQIRFYQTGQMEKLLLNAESTEEKEEVFRNLRIQ